MEITFLINTYGRQESCQRLVDSLQGLGRIIVLNDGCVYNINGCEQYFQMEHRGKTGYHATVNRLFSLRGKADYYIMLPDDCLPSDNMVEKAIRIWEGIEDPQKICLNIHADRVGTPCWTNFTAIDKGNTYLTQWVDMCFLCEDSFFRAVGLIPACRIGWGKMPDRGSGVGSCISIKLFRAKYNIYQVKEDLIALQQEHGNSQMRKYDNGTPRKYSRKTG